MSCYPASHEYGSEHLTMVGMDSHAGMALSFILMPPDERLMTVIAAARLT